MIDEQLAAHWRAQPLRPAARAMPAAISTASFEKMVRGWRTGCDEGTGRRFELRRSADDAPLYAIEPVAPSAVTRLVAQGGVTPMKVSVNSELQNKAGANASDRSTRHIEVQLPPGITLSRRRPPQRRAAQ
jgi:cytochrome P450/NADPH-cytochrome P450 reductase